MASCPSRSSPSPRLGLPSRRSPFPTAPPSPASARPPLRIFRLPPEPAALLFDLDSTLYTHRGYAEFQTSCLVERLARERGEPVAQTSLALARLKAERQAAGEGQTSLGTLFLLLGIPIATNVAWREELLEPESWLSADPRLDASLARLGGRFRLALVTNNPASIGRRSLKALGVLPRFELVLGLDDTGRSKPDPAPFALAASRLGLPAAACVSIGDRYEVDLAPALELGMGALLVEGVREVYALPETLGLGSGA